MSEDSFDDEEMTNTEQNYFVAFYSHSGLRCKQNDGATLNLVAAFQTLEEAKAFGINIRNKTGRDVYFIQKQQPTLIARDYRFKNPDNLPELKEKIMAILKNNEVNYVGVQDEYEENRERQMRYIEDQSLYDRDVELEKYNELVQKTKKSIREGKKMISDMKIVSNEDTDSSNKMVYRKTNTVDMEDRVCGNQFFVASFLDDNTETELIRKEPCIILYKCFRTEEEADTYIVKELQESVTSMQIHVISMHKWVHTPVLFNSYLSSSIHVKYRNKKRQGLMDGIMANKKKARKIRKKYKQKLKTGNDPELMETTISINKEGESVCHSNALDIVNLSNSGWEEDNGSSATTTAKFTGKQIVDGMLEEDTPLPVQHSAILSASASAAVPVPEEAAAAEDYNDNNMDIVD